MRKVVSHLRFENAQLKGVYNFSRFAFQNCFKASMLARRNPSDWLTSHPRLSCRFDEADGYVKLGNHILGPNDAQASWENFVSSCFLRTPKSYVQNMECLKRAREKILTLRR